MALREQYAAAHVASCQGPVAVSVLRARTVAVLMLFRDCAEYVRQTLPAVMDAVVRGLAALGLAPRFYFYENDSIDGTVAALKAVVAASPVVASFVHERSRVPNAGQTNGASRDPNRERARAGQPGKASRNPDRVTARTSRLAMCRNAVAGMAAAELSSATACLLIDTNIWLSAAHVVQLLEALALQPGAAMVAACTLDAQCREGHYYDTYAYTDLADPPGTSLHRYICPLPSCTRCSTRRARAGRKTPLTPPVGPGPVHEVASCFGGLAAVRLPLRAWWSATDDLCEHVAFCERLRRRAGKVYVVARVHPRWLRLYPSADDPLSADILRRLLREHAPVVGAQRAQKIRAMLETTNGGAGVSHGRHVAVDSHRGHGIHRPAGLPGPSGRSRNSQHRVGRNARLCHHRRHAA